MQLLIKFDFSVTHYTYRSPLTLKLFILESLDRSIIGELLYFKTMILKIGTVTFDGHLLEFNNGI